MRTARTSGVALLLTLWCVAVVAMATVGVARLIGLDSETESLRARKFEARELALTGIAHGSNPEMPRWHELLHQRLPGGGTLDVRVTSEGARLNINRLLQEPENPSLKRLFSLWGIPDEEARVAIDSLADWTDKNDSHRLNGAEREQLQNQETYSLPENRDFRSVEEMARVRGMDAVARRHPQWRETFSVYSADKLDIQDAPLDAMLAMGLDAQTAARIIEVRNGPDGVAGTKDDRILKDLAQAARELGADSESISQIFTTASEPVRVESRATLGPTRYVVTAVIQRRQGAAICWEEQ